MKSYTINLAPADVKKEGPLYDLGIAVGVLSASEQIEKKDYKYKEVKVVKTGCFGLCAMGPIVVIYPEGVLYNMVQIEDCEEIDFKEVFLI